MAFLFPRQTSSFAYSRYLLKKQQKLPNNDKNSQHFEDITELFGRNQEMKKLEESSKQILDSFADSDVFQTKLSHFIGYWCSKFIMLVAVISIVFNYTNACFRDPGKIPVSWLIEKKAEMDRKERIKKLQIKIKNLQNKSKSQNSPDLMKIMEIIDSFSSISMKHAMINENENENGKDFTFIPQDDNCIEQIERYFTQNPELLAIPEEGEEISQAHEHKTELGKKFSKFCNTCKQWKPERAHHCHVCKKCHLRMDHHCPWINNCVGYHNCRYFYLFMFYSLLTVAFCSGLQMLGNLGYIEIDTIGIANYEKLFKVSQLVSTLLGIAALLFALWHTYLVLTNQTTIEFQFHRLRDAASIAKYVGGLGNDLNMDVFVSFFYKKFFKKRKLKNLFEKKSLRGFKKLNYQKNQYNLGPRENIYLLFGVHVPKFVFFPASLRKFMVFVFIEEFVSWLSLIFICVLPISWKLPLEGTEWPKMNSNQL